MDCSGHEGRLEDHLPAPTVRQAMGAGSMESNTPRLHNGSFQNNFTENLSKIACQATKLQIPAPDKQIRVAHELSSILYP